MKYVLLSIVTLSVWHFSYSQKKFSSNPQTVLQNRSPLHANPYIELPLGAIQAKGWLQEQLVRMAKGSTGHLDEWYPQVMGKRNGWLGGDGDCWERGPYWLDGLLPLAYILHDTALIAKTKPWIEWAINSQRPDGYFGPDKDYPQEPGLQRNNSGDWWPKMVMLKVLMQYYSATEDPRVIKLFRNYFAYQLKQLPKTPLDHWTFWGERRGGDNLMAVYWLYNITGDKFLLDLAELIHKQTFNWTDVFNKGELLHQSFSLHGVNIGQGIKEPLIYYQQHPEAVYANAFQKGLDDLRKFNGQPGGMFGADEMLHGNNPTQGSELCTAVEMMYSLENALTITGNTAYADQLERIGYNTLPAQISADFNRHQYFQQANQVMITRRSYNFETPHGGTNLVFGFMTGYPCCTSNMHQGWPKLTQNLWYATADNGIAALVYAPSEVSVKNIHGTAIHITEETQYPFEETIRFRIIPAKNVQFPFHLRIPGWCKNPVIKINGKVWAQSGTSGICIINREWQANDLVELYLPMSIERTNWYEQSVAIERGPLVYALQIGEEKKEIKAQDAYGDYEEIRPTTPWNYGVLDVSASRQDMYQLIRQPISLFPWTSQQAPLQIKLKAKRLANWKLYNDMAGPLPFSKQSENLKEVPIEEITLIPYGCTKLRISEFPVVVR